MRVLSFYILHFKVVGFIDFPRLSSRVILQISNPYEDEAKVNSCINSCSFFRFPCTGCGFTTTS